eukprot:SAG31_NODE_1800_length_7238_cov_4.818602_8_plen_133_part_00
MGLSIHFQLSLHTWMTLQQTRSSRSGLYLQEYHQPRNPLTTRGGRSQLDTVTGVLLLPVCTIVAMRCFSGLQKNGRCRSMWCERHRSSLPSPNLKRLATRIQFLNTSLDTLVGMKVMLPNASAVFGSSINLR